MNGILGNEELSADDKVSKIIAERDADERGLLQNRDKFAGELKKAKEQIEAYNNEKTGLNSRISELEETLKKSASDNTATKEYWQSQFDGQLKAKDEAYSQLSEKYNGLQASFYGKLKNEAVNEAVKDFSFIDGLRGGFIASLLYNNKFTAKDIDGKTIFLNDDNRSIAEVAKDFALTNEGKAYLKNPSSGGGARSGTGSTSRVNTWTREEYNDKARTSPAEVREFFRKGGKIVD